MAIRNHVLNSCNVCLLRAGDVMYRNVMVPGIIALCGCSTLESKDQNMPVITDESQVDTHVGKMVVLRGVVSNTKIPTLLGVDVRSDDPDLRGCYGQACGLLIKRVVTQRELDEALRTCGQFSHRGPGTFYRLKEKGSELEVQVSSFKP